MAALRETYPSALVRRLKVPMGYHSRKMMLSGELLYVPLRLTLEQITWEP